MSSDPEPSGELSPKKNKQLRRPHASTRERLIKGFHGKIKHKYCHNAELAVKYYEPKDCGKEQSTQRWYVNITIDLLTHLMKVVRLTLLLWTSARPLIR